MACMDCMADLRLPHPAGIRVHACMHPCAGLLAVNDTLSVAANRQLQASVTANDAGLSPGALFTAALASSVTVRSAEGVTTQLPGSISSSSLFSLAPTGALAFNPAAAGVRPGARVSFSYVITLRGGGSGIASGGVKSNIATVTIAVTDAAARRAA